MNNIRDQFSDIMGLRIQNNNWLGYISILEREAHFNNVHRNQLIVALGQAVEEIQNTLKSPPQSKADLRIADIEVRLGNIEKLLQKYVDTKEQPEERDTDTPVQPPKK